MAHGGARQKAGRKANGQNRLTKAMQAAIPTAEELIGKGATPLQVMLEIMRDESKEDLVRLKAAADAAPFVHKRKPQSVEVSGGMTFTASSVIQIALPPHLAQKMIK